MAFKKVIDGKFILLKLMVIPLLIQLHSLSITQNTKDIKYVLR